MSRKGDTAWFLSNTVNSGARQSNASTTIPRAESDC